MRRGVPRAASSATRFQPEWPITPGMLMLPPSPSIAAGIRCRCTPYRANSDPASLDDLRRGDLTAHQAARPLDEIPRDIEPLHFQHEKGALGLVAREVRVPDPPIAAHDRLDALDRRVLVHI